MSEAFADCSKIDAILCGGKPDQSQTLHHHDYYKILLVREGNACCAVEGEQYHIRRGDIFLLSPTELHFVSGTPFHRYEICVPRSLVKPGHLGTCFRTGTPGSRNLLREDGAFQQSMFSAAREILSEQALPDGRSELMKTSLLTWMLVQLDRFSFCLRGAEVPGKSIRPILRFIDERLTEDLPLDVISRAFYMSRSALSDLFRRSMGISVHRYIVKRRLILSREFLRTGCSVGETSRLSGFADYSSFYRSFVKEYGVAPKSLFLATKHSLGKTG